MLNNILRSLKSDTKLAPTKVIMGFTDADSKPYLFLLTEKGREYFTSVPKYTLSHRHGITKRKMYLIHTEFVQLELAMEVDKSSDYTFVEYNPL